MAGLSTTAGVRRAMQVNPGVASVKWYAAFSRFLLGEKSLAPLAQALGGQALAARDPNGILRAQIQGIGILHHSFNKSLQDAFAQAVTAFLHRARPQACEEPNPAGPNPPGLEFDDQRRALSQDGYAVLPAVDPHLIAGLQETIQASDLLDDKSLYAVGEEAAKRARPAETLRIDSNLGHLPIEKVMALPGLLEIVADPETLALIRSVLGAPPVLLNVSVWRSFNDSGRAKEAREAQLFHYDLDDYRFCKLFVYLTDVDEDGGPHVFYPTTHRPEVCAAACGPQGSVEAKDFMAWYVGVLRKSEEDTTKRFQVSPVSITGKSGSRFLVQTSGIHRGAPPVHQDRVLLQCTYGVTPFTLWRQTRNWSGFRDRDGRRIDVEEGWARYLTEIVAPQTPSGPYR